MIFVEMRGEGENRRAIQSLKPDFILNAIKWRRGTNFIRANFLVCAAVERNVCLISQIGSR